MTYLPTAQQHFSLAHLPEEIELAISTWLGNINSAQTRRAYSNAWKSFMQFSGIVNPHNVTHADVIQYKEHLSTSTSPRTGNPYSQTTINLYLSALSSFYSYGMEHYPETIQENPVDGVKRKAVNPYGKATFLNARGKEQQKMLAQIDRHTLQGKRDYAMLRLFLTTGVRVAVVCNAYIGDVQQIGSRWVLNYTNKGGEADKAEITAIMFDIRQYLNARGISLSNSKEPLFTATPRGQVVIRDTGNAEPGNPLSPRTVNRLVKKYARKAGFANITAHSLRHTFALHAAQHGTVAQVSKLLRHKNMQITNIYLDHMTTDEADELTHVLAGELEG